MSIISAGDADSNQTDVLKADVSTSSADDLQNVLSASSQENSTANNTQGSAFLVLDNDADKENVHIGDYVTWILEAQNFGPDIAKNTKIHNTLPEGLKYIRHTTTKGTFSPETGIWDIGDLSIEEGSVRLLITTKAITAGEKVNKAYITTDTANLNNVTYEEEEMDVSDDTYTKSSKLEKSAKTMYETGNPIFLILASLFFLFIPFFKKQ